MYGYGILNNHVPTLRAAMRGGSAPSTLLTSLYAVYKGESNANDSLATYNGTAQGGLTYSSGKSGNAIDFNGTNAYVELPSNTINGTTNFAMSFWVYSTANESDTLISNFGNDGLNRGFYIDDGGSRQLRFVAFNGTPIIFATANSVLTLNTWVHFVFTCNLGIATWYVNGVSSGTPSAISLSYIANSKPIIGAFRTGNTGGVSGYKSMKFDEFNLWSRSLTPTEVTELYNAGAGKFYPY